MREREGESARLVAEMTPSLDLVFDLLSNRRRRYALYLLYDQPDGVATIDEVTDHVTCLETRELGTGAGAGAGTETGTGHTGETTADRKREIQVELQHVHLPKLEDAGILEIDHRSETLRYWTQPTLEEWLEHAQHKELS
ncbi:DUF7344 domain-containing protein [Natrarchaeobaculum aegyptiacum]|uniref:DUF7344 domain-containing protein n=1 Tax=Natrarchaeobaculum aegyptiacum TaxID=745377 RepID=A0A2Z2HUK9_9EURY|nr:hypothetical protein [Natrarchaeobaculum aegyptiacum]ARS90872.1 hypothetical protein B1756_14815 [Natrarchaeobaculum aegyptiacum]